MGGQGSRRKKNWRHNKTNSPFCSFYRGSAHYVTANIQPAERFRASLPLNTKPLVKGAGLMVGYCDLSSGCAIWSNRVPSDNATLGCRSYASLNVVKPNPALIKMWRQKCDSLRIQVLESKALHEDTWTTQAALDDAMLEYKSYVSVTTIVPKAARIQKWKLYCERLRRSVMELKALYQTSPTHKTTTNVKRTMQGRKRPLSCSESTDGEWM
eukprot:gnl/TRDRNA2_/TRDRNA2_33361_c0_seq1.p1 gnl/TRDRNA2_/TRDRNA2_33361_c0~~gnl/TRDRNA2_/TRDRNA2_33361_c0_seq1.p1  ORF type:complete len:212 (+),score=22.21 gnl/TRDRNA2_/TRDRNA2_33361_c0_seq1:56-691(+)